MDQQEIEAPLAAPASSQDPPKKKEVSPELLARLAKAREIAAQKRAAKKEQLQAANAFLQDAKSAKSANTANAVNAAATSTRDAPGERDLKSSKLSVEPSNSESSSSSDDGSSTDSSDTSDSEAGTPINKRGRKKKKKVRNLKLELEKAREKYKARYKNRYELLSLVQANAGREAAVHHNPIQTANNKETVKQGVKQIAKADVRQALHNEMMKATMKNLFGA